MKLAPTPTHETVLKQLRFERKAEDQRLYKLQMKVVDQLSRSQQIPAA
jgi:hypothetical protein